MFRAGHEQEMCTKLSIIWDESQIRFYRDDIQYHVMNTASIPAFHEDFFFIFWSAQSPTGDQFENNIALERHEDTELSTWVTAGMRWPAMKIEFDNKMHKLKFKRV